MKTENINFGRPERDEARWRMHATLYWIAALDAYDFGEPEPLSCMIESDDPIPEELRPALANIISGKRPPNKRAAAKLKMKPWDRMMVAFTVSAILGLIDAIKQNSIVKVEDMNDNDLNTLEVIRSLDLWADHEAQEMIDSIRFLEGLQRRVVARMAHGTGVSVETIENVVRDLRRKIENYPDV